MSKGPFLKYPLVLKRLENIIRDDADVLRSNKTFVHSRVRQ